MPGYRPEDMAQPGSVVTPEPTPLPRPAPVVMGSSNAVDASKKEYDAMMKEVQKYQAEFQQAMIIPSGTGATR